MPLVGATAYIHYILRKVWGVGGCVQEENDNILTLDLSVSSAYTTATNGKVSKTAIALVCIP